MGRKRDIVAEFKEYYDNCSDDAKLLLHSILLVKPKVAKGGGNGAGKSQSTATNAGRRSRSRKGLPTDGDQSLLAGGESVLIVSNSGDESN